MKKIFLIATMVAATVFASCSKNTDINTNETDTTGGPQVCLTLGTDTQTRAFFEQTAAAEPWEKVLTTLTVYAFDGAGKLIVKRSLTAQEVAAKSASLVLPNSAIGTNCTFYAVANTDYGDVANISEMDAMTESVTLDEYNGTFEETSKARKRTAGFVMTGKATATIAAGSPNKVSVALRRTVAKIAIRAGVYLPDEYKSGGITITSIKLSRASASSNSFYNPAVASRSLLYEFTQLTPQTPLGHHEALFYIYETDTLSEGNRVMLTYTGYFDADNSAATTDDRTDVEYKIELTGAGGGEFKRNGYYKINTVISGFSGNAVGVNVSVADWETPVTQVVIFEN